MARSSPLRVPLSGGLRSGRWSLPPEAAHYVVRVHRCAVGAPLLLTDGAARTEALGVLCAISERNVEVEVATVGAACHLPGRTVTWVQAIAKGEKMDQIVRDATELGATRIVPVAAERSIVRLQESPGRADARRERWERIAVEAARQCGRGDVPQIDPLRPLVSLWATVVADIRIVLQPGERTLPLHDVLQSATAVTSLAFAVGPEGGLTTEEISVALETGWITAHLGPFVLRTETVAAAVLGAVYMVNTW